MKEIELKIKYIYFKEIINNNKTFELRKNDRNFEVGDIVSFKVIDKELNEVEKEQEKNKYKVIYVLKNVPEYGLNNEYCIFSIKKI